MSVADSGVLSFDIQVPVKDLVNALSVVTSVMDKRAVSPILSCVKLSVTDNSLAIEATDGNIFARQSVGSLVRDVSTIVAVEGKLLERMIRGLDSEMVDMLYLPASNELLVKASGFELRLVTLPANEFPPFPQFSANASCGILSKSLYNLIYHTAFAASTEEVRYNLNGVCLHSAGDGKIFAAATDGFRLSAFNVDAENCEHEFKVILPVKVVDFLKNLSAPAFENHSITFDIGNNIVSFSSPKLMIVSKLVDGVFPVYDGLIPKNNLNQLQISKSLLASAIERVAGIADEKSRAIKISVSSEGVDIYAYTQSKGNARQSINASLFKYEGRPLEIAFQPKYLLDVLGLVREEVQVQVSFKDSASPVLISIGDLVAGKFVVMPIRI